jgi:hypothetical protein
MGGTDSWIMGPMRSSGIRRTRGPRRYRVVIEGELSERFASEFDGMSLESGGGQTFLWGEIIDQSHLHGILARIQDLGLDLISIAEVREGSSLPRTPSEKEER